jgi:hypothetical protein
MLVEIQPVLVGQSFGLGDQDISRLILSTRFQGFTLYPITEWPSNVYVTRILDEDVLRTFSFTKEQIELISWAALFQTLVDAEAYVRKLDNHA